MLLEDCKLLDRTKLFWNVKVLAFEVLIIRPDALYMAVVFAKIRFDETFSAVTSPRISMPVTRFVPTKVIALFCIW